MNQSFLEKISTTITKYNNNNNNSLIMNISIDYEALESWKPTEDIKPFLANVSILYSLKTPENQRFSDVFRGYKMETLARSGLRKH